MKRTFIAAAMLTLVAAPLAYVAAHCEVPCGIYDDGRRFTDMLEDKTTIAKAIDSVRELTEGLEGNGPDPKSVNQITRWITTKEDHATKLQHTISQYFMTQRIKPDSANYVEQITTAHKVLIAAMKCKQDADPATAVALEKAIRAFQAAYQGS